MTITVSPDVFSPGHVQALVALVASGVRTRGPILAVDSSIDAAALSAELASLCADAGHALYSLPRAFSFVDAAHEAACLGRLGSMVEQAGAIAVAGATALADQPEFWLEHLVCEADCAAELLSIDDAVMAGRQANILNLNDVLPHGDLSALQRACPNLISLGLAAHRSALGWPLPLDLGCSAGLRALQLSTNEIDGMPRGLLDCEALEYVFLANNSLRDLRGFEHLRALRVLDVRRNPLPATELARLRAALPDCELRA